MAFELPELPFEKQAMEPWTSAETFDYHHGKHHAAYVNKLNTAIEETAWKEADLLTIITETRDTPSIYNNAAQHFNHDFFWKCLSSEAQEMPESLQKKLIENFGSVESFKEEFTQKASTLFGSGWAWLVQNGEQLEIAQYKDADTPAGTNNHPLLTIDVWEHAYYIDHRNNRAGFIEGFWNHVNWNFVAENLK